MFMKFVDREPKGAKNRFIQMNLNKIILKANLKHHESLILLMKFV